MSSSTRGGRSEPTTEAEEAEAENDEDEDDDDEAEEEVAESGRQNERMSS